MVHGAWLYDEAHDLLNFLTQLIELYLDVEMVIDEVFLFCFIVVSHRDAIHIVQFKLSCFLIPEPDRCWQSIEIQIITIVAKYEYLELVHIFLLIGLLASDCRFFIDTEDKLYLIKHMQD